MEIRYLLNDEQVSPENPARFFFYNPTTELHEIAKTCNDLDTLDHMIHRLGDKAYAMSLITDDQGKLPVDLLFENNTLDDNIFDVVEARFHNLMMTTSIPPLQQSLDANLVLAPYRYIKDEDLNDNLRLGCELVNETRTYIKASYTHPDCMMLTRHEIKTLADRFDQMRLELKRYDNSYAPETIDTLANIIISYGCANCDEYATLLMNCLGKKVLAKPVYGEMLKLERGDHIFPVIGTSLVTDVANFRKYPKDEVVCDAFVGDVFPAFDILEHLKDHKTYSYKGKPLNVFTNFNLNHHTITHTGRITTSLTKTQQTFFYNQANSEPASIIVNTAFHLG